MPSQPDRAADHRGKGPFGGAFGPQTVLGEDLADGTGCDDVREIFTPCGGPPSDSGRVAIRDSDDHGRVAGHGVGGVLGDAGERGVDRWLLDCRGQLCDEPCLIRLDGYRDRWIMRLAVDLAEGADVPDALITPATQRRDRGGNTKTLSRLAYQDQLHLRRSERGRAKQLGDRGGVCRTVDARPERILPLADHLVTSESGHRAEPTVDVGDGPTLIDEDQCVAHRAQHGRCVLRGLTGGEVLQRRSFRSVGRWGVHAPSPVLPGVARGVVHCVVLPGCIPLHTHLIDLKKP